MDSLLHVLPPATCRVVLKPRPRGSSLLFVFLYGTITPPSSVPALVTSHNTSLPIVPHGPQGFAGLSLAACTLVSHTLAVRWRPGLKLP